MATTPGPLYSWPERSPSLWRCFATQCSAIYALMLRSVIGQTGKAKVGYFWELIDPILQVCIWFTLFTIIRGPRQIYDMNTFTFLSTGIISLFFFEKIAKQTATGSRQLGIYARFAVLTKADTIIASALLEAIQMVLVAVLLWGALVCSGYGFAPANPMGVISALACLAALGFGFGWFNAAFLTFLPLFYPRFLKVFYRVLFITSGAILPLERIPPAVFHYLKWNPVYQGVDLVRSSWSHTHDTWTSSYGYVLLWAAFLLLFGLILVKRTQRRLG